MTPGSQPRREWLNLLRYGADLWAAAIRKGRLLIWQLLANETSKPGCLAAEAPIYIGSDGQPIPSARLPDGRGYRHHGRVEIG